MLRFLPVLLKDSIVYGVANVIQKLTPLVIIPVITMHLGKTALKLYDVAFVYTYLFASLIILGLDSAASVFYFDKGKNNFSKKQVLSYGFFLQILSALIYIICVYPFKDLLGSALFSNDALVKSYWILALLILPGYIFYNYGLYVLLWQKRKREYVFICCLQTILSIVGVYGSVVFFNSDIKSVFYILIVCMTACGMLAIFLIRNDIFINPFPLNPVLIRRLLLFGVPFAFTSFFRLFISSIDRFFLLHFHFGDELPQYILASKVSSFISIGTNAFVLAFIPYSLNKINEDDAEKELSDVFAVILFGAFLSVPVLLIFKDVLIDFFADASYRMAERLFPFFFFGWVFDLFAYFSMLGVYKSQRSGVVMVILMSGGLLIVLLNLLLVPVLGLYGAASAFFMTKFLLFLGPFMYLKKFFRIHVRSQVFFFLFLVTALCSFLAFVVSFSLYVLIVCVLLMMVFLYFKKIYGLHLLNSFLSRRSH